MKKLSFVLALIMALTCLVLCPASAADNGTVFVFDFEELPFSKGKNGDCFFPNPERVKDAAFPEIYTWNSCTLSPDAGFVRVDVGGSPMLEFDSMPASYVINKEMPYLMVVIKADRAAENVKFNIVSQGNKYKRTYTTSLTGGWQKLVFDLTGADGWQIKGADGKYTEHNGAAYTEGGYGGGGFRFDMPGNAFVTSLTIDAMGFFKTETDANAYAARATVDKTETVRFGGASAPATGTTTPATPATPAEPEWEPSIFNATKVEEKKPVDTGAFTSVAPYGLNISENMVTLKFQNLVAGEKGAYSTGIEKCKIINTWGSIKNVSIESGLTKIELGNGNIFEITTFGGGVTAGTFPYWIVAYRTEKNATGVSNGYVYSASNKYRTLFPMICDGEWHYDVVKMDDVSKIEVKGENGYAADSSINPAEVGYGALRIDFPKYGTDAVYYLDYLAFFKTEEEAKAYSDKSVANLKNNAEKEDTSAEEETGFSYIKGYTDGTFGPNKNMTRAEAITVMARLVGNDEMINKERTSDFTDIKAGDWYFNAIAFLESLGMLENYEGKIEPNKKITRAEFIKLAYEAGAFEYSNKRPNFPDLQPSHPYYKEICLGYAANAITGFNDGTLGPDKEITRAQIVTIINRILEIPDSKAEASFSDIGGHWAQGAIMAAVGK